MKAAVTVKIIDLLPVPFTDCSVIDFGNNSNVFGRVYDTHKYFELKYGVSTSQIHILNVNFLD